MSDKTTADHLRDDFDNAIKQLREAKRVEKEVYDQHRAASRNMNNWATRAKATSRAIKVLAGALPDSHALTDPQISAEIDRALRDTDG